MLAILIFYVSGAFLVLVLGLGIATTTAFLEFLWVARTIFTAQNVSQLANPHSKGVSAEEKCIFNAANSEHMPYTNSYSKGFSAANKTRWKTSQSKNLIVH